MSEVIYIPAIFHRPIIDISFKLVAKECKEKGQKLVVHLNLGHLNNVGFNLITKGGIVSIHSYHLQQNIWCELADKVIFNHLDEYLILKDSREVNNEYVEDMSVLHSVPIHNYL